MYTVHLASKAEKDLKKLRNPVRSKILKRLFELSKNPHHRQFKFLKNHKIAQYRVRVGDYRILYDIYENDKTILIFRIGHRKDIYR